MTDQYSPEKCSYCNTPLTEEEIKQRECWTCGRKDYDISPLSELSNMPPGFEPEREIYPMD